MNVTTAQAAVIAGVDTATITRWANAGKLAGARIENGAWVVPVEGLENVRKSKSGRKRGTTSNN